MFAQLTRILRQAFFNDNLQGSNAYLSSNGVPAEGGAVLTGVDDAHDFVVREDCTHWVSTTGQGLAQDEDVRFCEGGLALAMSGAGAIAACCEQ